MVESFEHNKGRNMDDFWDRRLEVFDRAEEPNSVTIYADGRAIEYKKHGDTVDQMDHPPHLPPELIAAAQRKAEQYFRDQEQQEAAQ